VLDVADRDVAAERVVDQGLQGIDRHLGRLGHGDEGPPDVVDRDVDPGRGPVEGRHIV
jgi:hypothetical protein